VRALDTLTKNDITEVKGMKSPPAGEAMWQGYSVVGVDWVGLCCIVCRQDVAGELGGPPADVVMKQAVNRLNADMLWFDVPL
jgi:hypothetical protein